MVMSIQYPRWMPNAAATARPTASAVPNRSAWRSSADCGVSSGRRIASQARGPPPCARLASAWSTASRRWRSLTARRASAAARSVSAPASRSVSSTPRKVTTCSSVPWPPTAARRRSTMAASRAASSGSRRSTPLRRWRGWASSSSMRPTSPASAPTAAETGSPRAGTVPLGRRAICAPSASQRASSASASACRASSARAAGREPELMPSTRLSVSWAAASLSRGSPAPSTVRPCASGSSPTGPAKRRR